MKRRRSCAALALVALSGCYHYTIVSGAPPAAKSVTSNWQKSWVFGLVPPDTINTKAECPGGVAQFETQHSFLNSLVGGLTSNIFTPITTKYICSAGAVRR
jgi:Bor protein